MNLEMAKNSLKLCQLICDEKKRFVVEGEVNVPDIKPDMLNLVHVYADCFITGNEVTENRVKVEGVVDTYLIYLADDEEGSVRSITYPFRFTEYMDAAKVNEDTLIRLDCQVLGVDAKVLNGRKVNVKVNVQLHMTASNALCLEVGYDVMNHELVEMKKEKETICSLLAEKCDVATINETISLEDLPPIGEVLKASIRLTASDYKTSYHKILAKTEAIIQIVYVADDEASSIQSFETRIPVMGFIEMDELEDSMKIMVSSRVQNFSIKPIYQDMKATSFMVEGEVLFQASVYQNCEIEVLNDVYGLDKILVPQMDEIRVFENRLDENEELDISQTLLIPDLDRMKVLDVEAAPTLASIDVLEDKIALEGMINFDVLYYRTDRKTVENKRMELPFRQVVKMSRFKTYHDTNGGANPCRKSI